MNPKILDHYKQFSQYTYPGLYKEKLINDLPTDVREIGLLVRKSIIHRVTLANGNTGSNEDMRYGDMHKVPLYRQPEDDIFTTTAGMLAELYRRDSRGFVANRTEENKLILTCRYVAILMASILKSKGYAARARSGFDNYTSPKPNTAIDHWITQYWGKDQNRWITIDVDCSLEPISFDPYDMSTNIFNWSADSWLAVRNGKKHANYFQNSGGYEGLAPIAWELFYDFHCLMNDEIIYLHIPEIVRLSNFDSLTDEQLKEIDNLSILMVIPDDSYDQLRHIWETKKDYRLLKGALL